MRDGKGPGRREGNRLGRRQEREVHARIEEKYIAFFTIPMTLTTSAWT